MSDHRMVPILACNDLAATLDFYRRLGFALDADHGDYLILSDGKGWHLHLRRAEPGSIVASRNPAGLYLYTADVEAIADRVRPVIIEPGAPHAKPWGMIEFAVSDPDGVLVRIGRPIG